MTTALEAPAANWYPDPSGRAEARYWDGRMWTAHVVQQGRAALDPLDGVQQPRTMGPFAPAPAPTPTPPPDTPEVGHGTQALREMAANARPVRHFRSLPITSEPRITTKGAVGVFVGALVLFAIGLYFFHEGALTANAPPQIVSHLATLDQPDYRVSVPNAWPQRTTSETVFDAVYSVPDREILNVGVVDFADAALSDPATRDQHLAFASDMVAGAIGANAVLTERTIVKVGDTTLRVTTYDVTHGSGIVTRVREYVAVGLDRAVIVTAYGTPGAVERHVDAVAKVARTAKLKR